MRGLGSILVAVALLASAPPARAHEVLHEVRRGTALAVRAFESDGDAVADAEYQVYSPADPRSPHQRGRTDRGGWLAFVPDAPGRWRVKVVDDTGHGIDVLVDAAESDVSRPDRGRPAWAIGFVLRPLLGLLLIGGVFAVLFRVYRRKGPAA